MLIKELHDAKRMQYWVRRMENVAFYAHITRQVNQHSVNTS